MEKCERKFFRTPKRGNVVKVYYGDRINSDIRYGVVVDLGTDVFTEKRGMLLVTQQTVVLDEINPVDISEVNYFLPHEKTQFAKLLPDGKPYNLS